MFVDDFFKREYETRVNLNLLQYDYVFPASEMKDYVQDIIRINVPELLYFVLQSEDVDIETKDIFQFSNFNDATLNICAKLNEINDPGVTWEEAGTILLGTSVQRKIGALRKYGENHLKMASSLGLLYSVTNVFFLSGLGRVYLDLNVEQQNELIIRLVLRTKLIGQILRDSSRGAFNLYNLLDVLSPSTYCRRRSNIKTIVGILEKYDNSLFSPIIQNINYDICK